MAEALEIILAELSVEGSALKQTKKVDKELKKTKKTIKDAEKETKKFSKALAGLKTGKIGRGIKGAGRGARGGLGGGGLIAGLAGIPLVGGAIAAALAAAQSTKAKFIAGISLKKNLLTLSNDFQAAFNKEAKGILNLVQTKGGILFRKQDLERSFTALRDAGIDPKTIEDNAGKLAQFTKSQGFTSLVEGLNALASGQVKAGRGLAPLQIKQIQALAPLLRDVTTAQIGFERITKILKDAGPNLKAFADKTETNLKATTNIQNTIQREQERTSKAAAGKGGLDVFKTLEISQRITDKITRSIAVGTAPVMRQFLRGAKAAIKAAGSIAKAISGAVSFIEKNQKKAAKRGVIGPAGTLFSSILDLFESSEKKAKTLPRLPPPPPPPSQRNKEQFKNDVTININVSGGSASVAKDIAFEVEKVLSGLARTTFRQDTGLTLQG